MRRLCLQPLERIRAEQKSCCFELMNFLLLFRLASQAKRFTKIVLTTSQKPNFMQPSNFIQCWKCGTQNYAHLKFCVICSKYLKPEMNDSAAAITPFRKAQC